MNKTTQYKGYEIIRSVRFGTCRIFKGETHVHTEWNLTDAKTWIDAHG